MKEYQNLIDNIKNSKANENLTNFDNLIKEIKDIVSENLELDDEHILSLIKENEGIKNIILSLIKEIKNKLSHKKHFEI